LTQKSTSPRNKFYFGTQALKPRGSACRTAEPLYLVTVRHSGRARLKTFSFLRVNGTWSEDAGAGGAAARRQPQAEPNTHGKSKKRAAKRAPSEPRSQAGRTVQGRCGSAPKRAGPILSLTCDYYCSNLKGGKLFDKLPFGYSSEEEH